MLSSGDRSFSDSVTISEFSSSDSDGKLNKFSSRLEGARGGGDIPGHGDASREGESLWGVSGSGGSSREGDAWKSEPSEEIGSIFCSIGLRESASAFTLVFPAL